MQVQQLFSTNSSLSYFAFISAKFFCLFVFSPVKPEANAPISRNVDVSGSSSPFGGCSHRGHSSLALDGLYSRAVWGLTHADQLNAWPVWPGCRSPHGIEPRRERSKLCPSCSHGAGTVEGVESGKQCTSGALRLCQAWDVIPFFHLLNSYSLEISRNVSLFFTPPWLCTMPFLYLWLRQQEAAEGRDEDLPAGMAETQRCETGWSGLKCSSLKSGTRPMISTTAWCGAFATLSMCGSWTSMLSLFFMVVQMELDTQTKNSDWSNYKWLILTAKWVTCSFTAAPLTVTLIFQLLYFVCSAVPSRLTVNYNKRCIHCCSHKTWGRMKITACPPRWTL